MAVKVRNQCNAVIASRVSSGPELEHNGELWVMDQVAPHARFFVDVGAHVGSWARAFAARMTHEPRGLLFEPSPEIASALRLRLNAEGLLGFEIIEKAVGDRSGSGSFFAEPVSGQSSSLIAGHSLPEAKNITIEITSLDRELMARSIPSVDFLKVDAEGLDLHVLLGGGEYIRQRKIGVIQFEYNFPWLQAGSTLGAAYKFLENNGYKVFLLKKEGLFEFQPDTFGEFFSYSNFIAYCSSPAASGLDAAVKRRL
jgi:FkbM family methyltransferase